MNYARIHDQIIERALREERSRIRFVYERHHIRMKSLGGTNSLDNIVWLTRREHFIIHKLLFLMFPRNIEIAKAFAIFHNIGATSRKVDAVRLQRAIDQSARAKLMWQNPERKIIHSKRNMSYLSDVTYQNNRKINNNIVQNRQVAKQASREHMLIRWEDPEYRKLRAEQASQTTSIYWKNLNENERRERARARSLLHTHSEE